jgi:polysaccharide export outer membrane protein
MRNHRQFRSAATLVLVGCLAGVCRAQNLAVSRGISAAPTANPAHGASVDSVPPSTHNRPALVSQYTVGVADVLHVNVWKNPDLSQSVTVGPDGFVSLALLGDVKVVGLTTSELGQMLTNRLTAFIVTPQVTVSVAEIRSRQVYVMGQVAKPGGYPLIGQMSVLQMLAQAGGLNTFANRKGIYVLRPANGHTQKLSFNYVKVIHGKGDQNIDLLPGDSVIVP